MAEEAPDPERERARRYGTLPEPIRLEDTVAVQEVTAPRDRTMGRDVDRDMMLRFAG